MNRYDVFIRIVETGSFTQAAAESGYTQSAVSQMIRTLEHELNTTLFLRSKTGAELTPDGREYLPYIQSVSNARRELDVKCQEMQGLERGLIRVGTFTSVSRTWLPRFIKEFKKMYPSVQFILRQGDYTSICQWVAEGSVDLALPIRTSHPGLPSSPCVRTACRPSFRRTTIWQGKNPSP